MNKGIKLAHGEYLNFLNAGDCYYDKYALEKVISAEPQADILCGNKKLGTDDKEKIWEAPEKITDELLYFSTIGHQASFIKRDLFNQYGLYDENYKIASDWEKWIVFFLQHHCSYQKINEKLTTFDLTGISSCNISLATQERTEIINKYYSAHRQRILKKRGIKNRRITYTFKELLFSVKNDFSKKYKILTIFGIKIILKRHKK